MLKIEGLTNTIARLRGVKSGLHNKASSGLHEALETIVQPALQSYPPPLPNQKYVRTFRYYDSITTRVNAAGSTLIGITSSDGVSYKVFVRGNPNGGGQAAIHAGRWRDLVSIRRREGEHAVRELKAILVEYLQG